MGQHEAQPGKHRAKTTRHGRDSQPAGKHNYPRGASGGMLALLLRKLAGERGHKPKHGG